MARSVLVLAVTVLVLGVTLQEVSALRCWRCSSDASNAAFCNDPFDASIITEQQRRWSFVECSYPPGQLNPYNLQPNQRPVCKKTKQWVNNKSVISRSCYWEDINAPRDACANANTPEYIRTEFCETCDTEGCNGAGQFAPIALLVAIPTVIAKILLF